MLPMSSGQRGRASAGSTAAGSPQGLLPGDLSSWVRPGRCQAQPSVAAVGKGRGADGLSCSQAASDVPSPSKAPSPLCRA